MVKNKDKEPKKISAELQPGSPEQSTDNINELGETPTLTGGVQPEVTEGTTNQPYENDSPSPIVQQFDGTFVVEGKRYRAKLQKVNIPGIGMRTALELAIDSEAQLWLIKNNCIGSVIEEVVW